MPGSFDQRTGPVASVATTLERLSANWKKIALATVLALPSGQTYIWLAAPMYTSTASLFLDPRVRKADEIVQSGIGQDAALLESQVAILTSDSVLKKVVETLNLGGDPEFAAEKSTPMRMLTSVFISGKKTASLQDRALASLKKALQVSRHQKSYVFDISATTEQPAKSAAIVAAVVEAYFADQTIATHLTARPTNDPIEPRLGELRNQVREAERRADEYKSANKNPMSEGGIINEQELVRLSGELDAARSTAAASKSRRDQIQTAITSGGAPDVSDDAARSGLIASLREQYAEVARREASLSAQLHPRHPDIINARAELRAVKAQIATELKRLATAAESDYQRASDREKELAEQIDKTKQDIELRNKIQSRTRELDQEVAASRELFEKFLANAKEQQDREDIATPEARVLNHPVAPIAPSKPNPLIVLAFSLMAGLTAGVLWALRSTKSDDTLASADQLINQTGIQSVAVIPELKKHFGTSLGERGYAAFGDLIAALDLNSNRDAAPYQQAVLRLLSKIKSLGRAGRPNTVMFASPRPSAGNSASTLAVAYKAALSGERVLLVDATSTNPELSSILAANLANATTVILDSKEHLNKIVTRDEKSGLAFLPIALGDLRTLRVQQRRRLVAGLNLLSQDYDWIFIDAGSLLDDEAATTLLPATDIVFLVGRAGATTHTDVNAMLQMLEPARARIAGAVLTFGKP